MKMENAMDLLKVKNKDTKTISVDIYLVILLWICNLLISIFSDFESVITF